jgi:hypothetical protein
MKNYKNKEKICITILILSIIILSLIINFYKNGKTEYLRVHIRANEVKNEKQALNIVFNELENFANSSLSFLRDYSSAKTVLLSSLFEIEKQIEKSLKNNNIFIAVTVKVEKMTFLCAEYDNFTCFYGEYETLVIILGSGQGKQIRGVIYPSLQFDY